jgi:hypothetical protein
LTTTDADSQTNLETNLNSTVDGETEIAAEAAVETPEEAVVQTITELTGPADQTKVTVARNEENYIEVERASEETRSPTNHQVEITGPQNAEKTTVDHSNTIYREREIPKASITVDQPAEETESSVAPAAAEQNSETVNQAATMTPADTASIENTITIEVSSPDSRQPIDLSGEKLVVKRMLEIPETSSQPIAPSPELKFQKLAREQIESQPDTQLPLHNQANPNLDSSANSPSEKSWAEAYQKMKEAGWVPQ